MSDPILPTAELLSATAGLPPATGEAFEHRFHALVAGWKRESLLLSSPMAMARLPSYQAIISLGMPVVPLLLRELEREPDHWFIALNTLTGAEPVAPEHRGKIAAMAGDWVRWGKAQGYRW